MRKEKTMIHCDSTNCEDCPRYMNDCDGKEECLEDENGEVETK